MVGVRISWHFFFGKVGYIMNDVEFILREEAKEKKSAGRGYHAKKNGSKSKKCSLPHDNLSKKRIKENEWRM